MAQSDPGDAAPLEAAKGPPADWNDPEVFGDLSPPSPSAKALPNEVPETFRPVTQSGRPPDDDQPLDTSRFIKKSNPFARLAIGVGVAACLGLLGFAVSRGPGHTAAEEVVRASAGPGQEANEALNTASMDIGRACGKGGAPAPATVRVTFAPEGHVVRATVVGPLAGTEVGECVATKVRALHSRPFAGPPLTVTEQISLSPLRRSPNHFGGAVALTPAGEARLRARCALKSTTRRSLTTRSLPMSHARVFSSASTNAASSEVPSARLT
jgi:hypothetical protein